MTSGPRPLTDDEFDDILRRRGQVQPVPTSGVAPERARVLTDEEFDAILNQRPIPTPQAREQSRLPAPGPVTSPLPGGGPVAAPAGPVAKPTDELAELNRLLREQGESEVASIEEFVRRRTEEQLPPAGDFTDAQPSGRSGLPILGDIARTLIAPLDVGASILREGTIRRAEAEQAVARDQSALVNPELQRSLEEQERVRERITQPTDPITLLEEFDEAPIGEQIGFGVASGLAEGAGLGAAARGLTRLLVREAAQEGAEQTGQTLTREAARRAAGITDDIPSGAADDLPQLIDDIPDEFIDDIVEEVTDDDLRLFMEGVEETAEPSQRGAIQSGFGIGEAPSQGQLFPESPTGALADPLADPDAIAGQAARREAIEQGQQTLDEAIEGPNSLEAARRELDEAIANAEAINVRGAPAPRFGTPERAAFDAERARLAAEGTPVAPLRTQRQQANQRLRAARENVARLEGAKREFVDAAAPDGIRQPPVIAQEAATPAGVRTAEAATTLPQDFATPTSNPASLLERVHAGRISGERLDQRALTLHEAALNTAERHANEIVRLGNQRLRRLNIGASIRGTRAARPQDIPALDNIHRALHNRSRVDAGEILIAPEHRDAYNELRELMDWESSARIDFDPNMATVDDYFYRGWKPPESMMPRQGRGQLVNRPDFMRQRNSLSYDEMRELGFEPLHWNPYEQWKVARMQGIRYRQQMELVDALKNLGEDVARPHNGGAIPDGWRVPRIGPAFEGKPFPMLDEAGLPQVGYTRRWMVPDRVANTLESVYGVKPDLGRVAVGGRSFDIQKAIDTLVFLPKRAKLFGSFFQQVDFLTRAGIGSWHGMVNALATGHPVQAVGHLARYPRTAADIIGSYFVPAWRRSLRSQLNSTESLIPGRTGVNLKGINDAGLSTIDVTILPRDIDAVAREIANETGILGTSRAVRRQIENLEAAMRRGLFEGVYPAAIINDVKNNIAPIVGRIYPHLSDEQMNSVIARLANTRYSSIPASQSVIQNRSIRETLRRLFFSINESEGLLRQATGALKGPQKRFWIENWLGAYLFLMGTANAIHFATTGEALPKRRYVPIWASRYAPFGYGYNPSFAAPTLREGPGEIDILLDVVGQMDTAFRVMDPVGFVTSRESVPVRAFQNQIEAQDFYDNPIDEVGPGGIVSRTTQLAQDLFAPIGIGQAAINVLSQEVPESQLLISGGEQKLDTTSQLIQGTGLNLRAETLDEALRERHPNWDNLPPATQERHRKTLIQEVYGPRNRLQEERFQDRIWEVFRPTEAEVRRFEQKMDRKYGPRTIPRRRMVEPR